jgi:hypothetical protein
MQTFLTTAHKVAALIPHDQYTATIKPIEEILIRIEERLEKCPKLGETEGMEEHPAILHYFYEETDVYVCEFDGKDKMFGFTFVGGKGPISEWGFISLSELLSIPVMRIDYYLKEKSIEAALYRQFPRHFKIPASLERS